MTAPVSDESPVSSTTYVTINPLLHHVPPSGILGDEKHPSFDSVINPLDESFSVTRAIGDIAYSYRHKLVFDRMAELNEYPPNFTYDRSTCSASDSDMGTGMLLPHARSLTCSERQAIYHTLSENLGPTHGIQESQGTYRKYMEDRARLYYEDLLSVPQPHTLKSDRPSTSLKRTCGNNNEFRFWLSETKFLQHDGINDLPRPKHDPNVTRQHAVASNDKRNGHRTGRHWGQTLDDLFPTPLQDSSSGFDITQSPVVHAGNLAYMAPWFFTLPKDECSEGDDVLFSAMFDPSIFVPPAQSVAELRQSRRGRFHGLADFPGLQGVTIPAKMEDLERSLHLQCPLGSVLSPGNTGLSTLQDSAEDGTLRRTRKGQNNARTRFAPCSAHEPQLRDWDRIRTRSITSRGGRRRTSSAAGGI
ncbi:hypothetical protein BS17DRAFT_872780 [Gyrodon lividus]|nr:hypothetical protein BS17DRAFT_872780 [Gyrodon lividus]